jgi:hypothetical protein
LTKNDKICTIFILPVKLLNLPTNGTVLLSFTRRILSPVIGSDIFRALDRTPKPEQLHSPDALWGNISNWAQRDKGERNTENGNQKGTRQP